MPKHILLFIYNSFADPIVQGSVLTYINRYKTKLGGQATFTLITFEQADYSLSESEITDRKKHLAQFDIIWKPLKYHSGGWLIIFKKIYDLLNGLFLIVKLHRRQSINLIYTVGSIGGAMGYVLSKFIGSKLLVHTFEPHSEFMADFGIWKTSSVAFKMLNYMEGLLSRKASYLMTATDAMIHRIKKVRDKNGVYKVPSCVDLNKFKLLPEARERIRTKFDLDDKFVLLYVGKFGGIYFTDEPFTYFKHFLEHFENKNPHVLIVSPNETSWIKQELDNVGVSKDFTILNKIKFAEIQDYINTGDIGYCGIPPLPSQKYRSPIKNGEYLACGIPYIVYEGVSEDDIIAQEYKVGVVLKDNSTDEILSSFTDISKIMDVDKLELASRCRETAISYRGIQQTDKFFIDVFE